VVDRLQAMTVGADTVVATSAGVGDDAIAAWCAANRVSCFRGSEEDVLGRYAACAAQHGFSQIVRLTADNPFTDIEELDRLIRFHESTSNDYSHSFGQLPVGVGAEIFTRDALTRSEAAGTAPHHREHVNEYIHEHAAQFRTGALDIPAAKVAPALRLTVDTPEDFARATAIVESGAAAQPSIAPVLDFLRARG
jgi:spore coat polysaccharide biosynthesis protein SpsF